MWDGSMVWIDAATVPYTCRAPMSRAECPKPAHPTPRVDPSLPYACTRAIKKHTQTYSEPEAAAAAAVVVVRVVSAIFPLSFCVVGLDLSPG